MKNLSFAFFKRNLILARKIFSSILQTKIQVESLVINQGRILSKLNSDINNWNLQKNEFKIFSQWGEDGIIQFLVDKIEIENKTFIEFGVEDYSESNTRFLLTKDNWSGFVVDPSLKNVRKINNSFSNWKFDLVAKQSFITTENVNDILKESNFPKDLGILSIDIDGNDYHILNALTYFRPRIIICEYNSLFGSQRKITVPYIHNFSRGNMHFSNLYYGASLGALNFLCSKMGYQLVGTNSHGVNAFFVRKDLLPKDYSAQDFETLFTQRKFKEARNLDGRLNNMNVEKSIELLRGMKVQNVETGELETY